MSEKERFMSHVNKTEGCWMWVAYKDRKGYGKFGHKKGTLAHRFSYILHNGKIPKGMQVCHSCDNPSCVNPNHLWVGTNRDNQMDCISKGRARRNSPFGEKNGLSKLTDDQVRDIKIFSESMKQAELAIMYDCHPSNISFILSGKTWKHVC